MNTLAKTFLRGLLAFLPVFLTIYAVLAFGNWLDDVTTGLIERFLPALPDVPGLGIALSLIAILVLGALLSSRLTRWIYNAFELPLKRLPLISDLYTALKQMTSLVAPADASRSGRVVRVQPPGQAWCLIGVQTRDDAQPAGLAADSGDKVGVYLPLSYQIGGYTLFVPREWIVPLDMSVDTAMREALTGWIDVESPAASKM